MHANRLMPNVYRKKLLAFTILHGKVSSGSTFVRLHLADLIAAAGS